MVEDNRCVSERSCDDFVVKGVVVDGVGDSLRFFVHMNGRTESNQ